jgi:uncharacterized Tic20 family protein
MSESIPPLQPVTPVTAPSSTRSWEVLCHLSSLVGLLFGFFWIPFLNILGPLIVWLAKRNDSIGIDAHGKEAVNFHLSWTLYAVTATAVVIGLCFVLIGFLMLPLLWIGLYVGLGVMIVLTIIAAVKASNGELYRYPLTIRFLK